MEHRITVYPAGRVIKARAGENLLQALASGGIAVAAPCGGRGTCGKCRVHVVSGEIAGAVADANGDVLACRASVAGDLVLRLPKEEGGGLDRFSDAPVSGDEVGLGAVLDIGTTTLALCLIDRPTGRVLKSCSALNPQGVLGADVLSRIQAWGNGKGALLQGLLLERVRTMLGDACVQKIVVAANTTMLHLLLNADPTSIGVYPFTPRFTATQRMEGASLGWEAGEVCLLPSVSAFIGSDVTAGILSCGMDADGQTSLFIDVGTNGEIVLAHGGKLYATSAAAGPALEGACIECGMGGVSGAVDRVSYREGVLCIGTVDAAPARGICGSGLIDLIALLRREGILDESGAWDDSDSPLAAHLRGDRFYLCEDVYLSGRDVRQYQLAKSAITSAVITLLDTCGVYAEQVERVFIAGGLGYYMDIENAVQTGLLLRVLKDRCVTVGNTALAGARLCLCDSDAISRIERIAASVQTVELGASPAFSEAFMMNMMLEEV